MNFNYPYSDDTKFQTTLMQKNTITMLNFKKDSEINSRFRINLTS